MIVIKHSAFTLLEIVIVLFLVVNLFGFGTWGVLKFVREQQFFLEVNQVIEVVKLVKKSSFICDVDLVLVFENRDDGLVVGCHLERGADNWRDLMSLGLSKDYLFSKLSLIDSVGRREWRFISQGTEHPFKKVVLGGYSGLTKELCFSKYDITREYPL